MKLTQYINESGQTQWRTEHGSVVPAEYIDKWQKDTDRIKARTEKTKQYLEYLQQLIANKKNENN